MTQTRLPSGLRFVSCLLACVITLSLLGAPVLAADLSKAGVATSVADSAAVLGPLGISPFLALASLGLASMLGIYTLPSGLEPFGHPVVVVLVGLLAFGLHVGRSTKLTKPLAETAGLGESLFGVLVAMALALPHFSESGAREAGVLGGMLFLSAAASGVLALVVLRTALDVIIWLSPFPFVDAAFQAVKLVVTGLLVVTVVLAPPIALVLNGLILIGTFFVVRWALRTLRFGLTIAYDLTFGRWRSAPRRLPRDAVVPEDLGPFRCFALEAPGFARRSPAHLELRAGRWFLVGPRAGAAPATPLGDGHRTVLTPTWAGLELTVGDATVLLPPRYRSMEDQIRVESRATLGDRSTWIPRARGVRVSAH